MIWSITLLPLQIIDQTEAHRCLQLWLWHPNSQQISHRQSLTLIQTRWRNHQSQTKLLPQRNFQATPSGRIFEHSYSVNSQLHFLSMQILINRKVSVPQPTKHQDLQVLQPAPVNLYFPALRLTQTIAHADTKPSATESCPRSLAQGFREAIRFKLTIILFGNSDNRLSTPRHTPAPFRLMYSTAFILNKNLTTDELHLRIVLLTCTHPAK